MTTEAASKTKISLSRADADTIQDAWHYAMMILDRKESTFDGDREYPEGVRGQMKAYENLLGKINDMAAGNETWELVQSQWWIPSTWYQLKENTEEALAAICQAASRLGVEPRTGDRIAGKAEVI